MSAGYLIPAAESTAEIADRGSRFLGICTCVESVKAARAYLADVRGRYADASHHVYAFAIGHGSTVTHGMSDDREPSGTAGRPVLAVVEGSGLGDLIVVVVRWFGGTKLGTGGLVRAYTKAAQKVLSATPTARRVQTTTVVVRLPYDRYDPCREALRRAARQDPDNAVNVVEEAFAEHATLHLCGPEAAVESMLKRFGDLTSGRVEIVD
ncbi:MAG: YigZ family protein [Proteobacteria bacterium]|nr:YigZ family protein [Pseudomonadota bacterium]